MIRRCLIGLLALPAIVSATPVAPALASYAVTQQIAVPADGRWDYSRVDPALRRLFIARGDSVTAIDLARGTVLPPLGSISRGHAVVPIDGEHLLLVTSASDDTTRLIDPVSGAEIAKITVGTDPDAAVYDAATHRAYVMNAKAGTVSVIDVAKRAVRATVTLKPGLESTAIDGGTLFVANEDANEIERIDLAHETASQAIALPGCEGPAGFAGDPVSHRLIAACANGKAVVVDARSAKVVAMLDIGKGPDAVIVDVKRRVAFVPCGRDAVLDVIALDAPGGPAVVAHVPTEAGARSGAVDPVDGAVYLPTARFGPTPAGGGRPPILAGSFHVLVVRPGHA